jgi:complex III assembly factor LYRM7
LAAREGFEKERFLQVGGEEAAQKITYAQEVAKILRENVLQGKATKEDPSKYSKSLHRAEDDSN